MFSDQDDPPGGYTRHESESQRLDRNFGELLQELRVTQAGVQILFGFLLSMVFQSRFTTLDHFELAVYLTTLISSALAVTFLTGPVAAHRLLFRRGVKDFLVRYTARMAALGVGFLAVAVIGGVILVTDVLLSRGAALGIGGGLAAVGVLVWIVIPFTVRNAAGDPER